MQLIGGLRVDPLSRRSALRVVGPEVEHALPGDGVAVGAGDDRDGAESGAADILTAQRRVDEVPSLVAESHAHRSLPLVVDLRLAADIQRACRISINLSNEWLRGYSSHSVIGRAIDILSSLSASTSRRRGFRTCHRDARARRRRRRGSQRRRGGGSLFGHPGLAQPLDHPVPIF